MNVVLVNYSELNNRPTNKRIIEDICRFFSSSSNETKDDMGTVLKEQLTNLVALNRKGDCEAFCNIFVFNTDNLFNRNNLIDYVNIVIAPVLVGGRDTTTLVDGESISSPEELDKIRPLKLIECKQLNDSYVQLRYEVMHSVK